MAVPPSSGSTGCAMRYAVADLTQCTGCELCADSCPVSAITMQNQHPQIDVDRCIGCGACVIHCPKSAITMKDR
jgi:ferredoxin